jgi:hypothetical protein
MLSGPARVGAELMDITHRRDAEEALVLPIEVRGVAVAHAKGRAGRVEVFAQHRPRRMTGKEPVLLAAATAQGPGTLIITTATVAILRRPLPGNVSPSIEVVPRTAIVSVTSETPLGFPLFSFFGVLTDVLLQTNVGKRYRIERVPIWQARKVVRLLS